MSIDLLSFTENGGCSAKLPAAELEKVLSHFPKIQDKNLLVDIDTQDDAAVYKINDDQAIIFTTDFFPPLCSDPFEFGQIAAANSLSDVYAMGGTPLLALNIAMFPGKTLPLEAYAKILEGGQMMVNEASAMLVGGHTIDDAVPKYGLAVVGLVHPNRIVTNAGLEPGDVLILTKPIGSGILISGHRVGLANIESYRKAIENMKILNKNGLKAIEVAKVKGGTDITGFGLLGHALKMARASNVTIRINTHNVPLLPQAYELAEDGCIPGAAFRNIKYVEAETHFSAEIPFSYRTILADAQTSGGLLLGIKPEIVSKVVEILNREGAITSAIIGVVEPFNIHRLIIE